MNKPFSTIVYIGRFQPVHLGHTETIKKAQSLANQVIILVGSSNKPRTIKNPFTYDERYELITSMFPNGWKDKELENWTTVRPIEDNLYDDNAWASNVQKVVGEHTVWQKPGDKIGIIGYDKDESSFYLKMFPQWESIKMENVKGIDGTELRLNYFQYREINGTKVPEATRQFLVEFRKSQSYPQLVKEQEFIRLYKFAWANSPYPPTFVTVDAVVFYCGHVLLVKRKAEPGKGLWALPGGFIGANEKIKDACVRELYEETKLGLYPSELAGMYRNSAVFDHPQRSLRGRTITHAYHYQTILPFERLEGKLPKVKGSDDAEVARWFQLGDVLRMGDKMFEDHYDIIRSFL